MALTGEMENVPKTCVYGLRLTLCVSLALSAQMGSAQDASAPAATSSNDLGDIIVTARRVEERLQDVPVSIQVFNQQQLTDHNVTNANELAEYTPSLSTNPNFGTDETTFAIRGFNQDEGSPPSVGVYFADVVSPRGNGNGIPIGDGANHGDFFDLANVQVLKGPQGTLFGLNTTGGAVLFVPQKPTGEFGGYAELSYGNYSMHREQAALNLPLSDTVRFRLAVDQMDRGGYLNNDSGIGPARLENTNYTAARASLVIDLTPNLENYTIASFARSDDNGGVQKVIACDPTSTFGAAFACPQLQRELAKGQGFYTVQQDLGAPETLTYNYQLINTTTWHATDAFNIKNIASYSQLMERVNNPLFGTDWPIGGGLPPVVFSTIQSAPGDWSSSEFTFTDELQVNGTVLNDRLTYQGGLYVEGSDPISAGGNQSPVFASCFNASNLATCSDPVGIGFTQAVGAPVHVGSVNYTVGEDWYRDFGIYEQSTYTITDQLKATAGARFTYDQTKNESTRITNQFPVTPPFTQGVTSFCTDVASEPTCAQTTSETSHAPTWMLDLEYKPLEEVLVYGKYSRGYRAGGVFANSPANYRTFQPEKLDSFEAGFKTTLNGPVRGTFNVTGFYNNFRNQQLQASFDAAPGAAVSPTTGIINAGKSKIWGAEIEATLTPVTGLTFAADYTYLRTEITAIAPVVSTDPNYIVGANIPVGSPLELSPKNKAVVSINYTLPLPASIGKISAGVTGTHTDQQLANYVYVGAPINISEEGGNYSFLKATNLLDANASWNSIMGSTIDLSFFGTNLTNLHYFSYIPGLGTSAVGFETAVLGEPRMFGVRARYRFGGG
jgi:iron complex outermembrane receptor protein